MSNYDKMTEMMSTAGVVSVAEIRQIMSENLRVMRSEVVEHGMAYYVTRMDKSVPWPESYAAGDIVDNRAKFCCSYSGVDDRWPKDTRKLTVYLS